MADVDPILASLREILGGQLRPTMKVAEVCSFLTLDRRTVYAMLGSGELEGNRRGHVIRVFTPSVIAWARGARPAA